VTPGEGTFRDRQRADQWMAGSLRMRCGVTVGRITTADMAARKTDARRTRDTAFFAQLANQRGRKLVIVMRALISRDGSHSTTPFLNRQRLDCRIAHARSALCFLAHTMAAANAKERCGWNFRVTVRT